MDNYAKLLQVVADLFRVDSKTLNDNSSQDSLRNWDSIGTVSLVSELEQVFGVRFDVLEVQDLKNIGIIKSVLAEKGIAFPS